jgi:hypothetical protein
VDNFRNEGQYAADAWSKMTNQQEPTVEQASKDPDFWKNDALEGMDIREEIIADALGDNLTNPEFWGKLNEELEATEKGMAAKLIDALKEIIGKFVDVISPFKHEKYVKDAAVMQTELAKLAANHMKNAHGVEGAKQAAKDVTLGFAKVKSMNTEAQQINRETGQTLDDPLGREMLATEKEVGVKYLSPRPASGKTARAVDRGEAMVYKKESSAAANASIMNKRAQEADQGLFYSVEETDGGFLVKVEPENDTGRDNLADNWVNHAEDAKTDARQYAKRVTDPSFVNRSIALTAKDGSTVTMSVPSLVQSGLNSLKNTELQPQAGELNVAAQEALIHALGKLTEQGYRLAGKGDTLAGRLDDSARIAIEKRGESVDPSRMSKLVADTEFYQSGTSKLKRSDIMPTQASKGGDLARDRRAKSLKGSGQDIAMRDIRRAMKDPDSVDVNDMPMEARERLLEHINEISENTEITTEVESLRDQLMESMESLEVSSEIKVSQDARRARADEAKNKLSYDNTFPKGQRFQKTTVKVAVFKNARLDVSFSQVLTSDQIRWLLLLFVLTLESF